jgi:uncharacterized protein YjbI with pentapeptide repeats
MLDRAPVCRMLGFVLAFLAAGVGTSHATNRCIDAKNRAAVKALECLVKVENSNLLGKPADSSVCSAKLAAAFTKAEAADPYCWPVGDYAAVQQRVSDAEAAIIAALQAGSAATPAAKKCVVAKNKNGARGARCIAALMSKLLLPSGAYLYPKVFDELDGYVACKAKIATAFQKAEYKARGECPTSADAADVQQLASRAGTNLQSANLGRQIFQLYPSGAVDLTGANLQGAALYETNISQVRFDGADLRGAYVYDAYADHASFEGADCSGASFENTYLSFANMRGTNLVGARLDRYDIRRETLYQTDFTDADLTGVSMTYAFVSYADFTNAKLTNVRFTNATLTSTRFPGADLTGATFATTVALGLDGRGLVACPAIAPPNWHCVNLNLVGPAAMLEGVDLSGTNLGDFLIDGASFLNANLAGVNLEGSSARGATFTGANLTNTNLADTDFYRSFFSGADLTGADVAGASFIGAAIDGTDLTGVGLAAATIRGTYPDYDHLDGRSLVACPDTLPADWTCTNQHLVGPGAVLTGVDLSGVDLNGRNFYETRFGSADLSNANLSNAFLTWASFYGGDLSGANLTGAMVYGARLDNVDLAGTNLTNAYMDQSVVTGAMWSLTICPDASVSDANGTSPESCCGHMNGGMPLSGCS